MNLDSVSCDASPIRLSLIRLPEYLNPQDALTGHSGLSVARRCEDVRVFPWG